MNYKPRHYATALTHAFDAVDAKTLHVTQSQIVKNFLRLIARNGDAKKYKNIITAFEKLYIRAHGMKKVDIVSARPLPTELRTRITRLIEKPLVTEKVNPRLISGLTITIDNEILIDASAKSRIDELFAPRELFIHSKK